MEAFTSFAAKDFIVPIVWPSVNVMSFPPWLAVMADADREPDANKKMSVAWIFAGGRPLVKIGSFSFSLSMVRTR